MAKRKREDNEIKRDRMTILERVQAGVPTPDIFAEINAQYAEVRDTNGTLVRESRQISRPAFQKDMDAVLDKYVEVAKASGDRQRAMQLRKLYGLMSEAEQAWKRSQKPEVVTTMEAYTSNDEMLRAVKEKRDPKPDKVKTITRSKGQVGDGTFLAEMRKLSREIRELLGLDLSKPANRPPPEEQPDMEPAEAGALLMGLMAKAVERFDTALKTGALPQGIPIPRALLPEGFEPPPDMNLTGGGVIIDVEPEPEAPGQSEDEILAALEREAEAADLNGAGG